MVNIIRVRQAERLSKIEKIQAILSEAGAGLDMDKLILACCADWGITERTIKEYIKIAKFRNQDGK